MLSLPRSDCLRDGGRYSILAEARGSWLRVEVSVSVVVKKTVVIPALSTVAPVLSSAPHDALHPIEDRLGIPGRMAAVVHGFLDLEPSYGAQERRG